MKLSAQARVLMCLPVWATRSGDGISRVAWTCSWSDLNVYTSTVMVDYFDFDTHPLPPTLQPPVVLNGDIFRLCLSHRVCYHPSGTPKFRK